MSEISKETVLKRYKNIIGNTKDTIDAIQKYINNHSKTAAENSTEKEEKPAASINKILNSTADKEINSEIKKIIDNL